MAALCGLCGFATTISLFLVLGYLSFIFLFLQGFGVASGTAAKLTLPKGGDTTLAELRVATAILSKVSTDKLRVRSGFPPKCLLDSPPEVASEQTTTLVEAGLLNHDTVLIERETDATLSPPKNPSTKGKGKGKGKGKPKQTTPTKQKGTSTGIATLRKSATTTTTTTTTRSKRKWGEGQALGSTNDNDDDEQPPSSSSSSASTTNGNTNNITASSGHATSNTGHKTNTNTNANTATSSEAVEQPSPIQEDRQLAMILLQMVETIGKQLDDEAENKDCEDYIEQRELHLACLCEIIMAFKEKPEHTSEFDPVWLHTVINQLTNDGNEHEFILEFVPEGEEGHEESYDQLAQLFDDASSYYERYEEARLAEALVLNKLQCDSFNVGWVGKTLGYTQPVANENTEVCKSMWTSACAVVTQIAKDRERQGATATTALQQQHQYQQQHQHQHQHHQQHQQQQQQTTEDGLESIVITFEGLRLFELTHDNETEIKQALIAKLSCIEIETDVDVTINMDTVMISLSTDLSQETDFVAAPQWSLSLLPSSSSTTTESTAPLQTQSDTQSMLAHVVFLASAGVTSRATTQNIVDNITAHPISIIESFGQCVSTQVQLQVEWSRQSLQHVNASSSDLGLSAVAAQAIGGNSRKKKVDQLIGMEWIQQEMQSLNEIDPYKSIEHLKKLTGVALVQAVDAKSNNAFKQDLKHALRSRQDERKAEEKHKSVMAGTFTIERYEVLSNQSQTKTQLRISYARGKTAFEETAELIPPLALGGILESLAADEEMWPRLHAVELALYSPRMFWNVVHHGGVDQHTSMQDACAVLAPGVDWDAIFARKKKLKYSSLEWAQ